MKIVRYKIDHSWIVYMNNKTQGLELKLQSGTGVINNFVQPLCVLCV